MSTDEESLLKYGTNFAVTPTELPIADLIVQTEHACKQLGAATEQSTALRSDVVEILKKAKPPPSNISKAERLTIKSLREDKSIMILPADKGRATVVMNTEDYDSKAKSLLEDTRTYQPLKKDPTKGFKRQLVQLLQELKTSNAISQQQYYYLYPTAEDIPKFYGLPKIHKANAPLRPIVACRGTIVYNVAKFVAQIIAPLVGKSQYHIENSKDLVNKLSVLNVGEEESLVSYDVTALFTSTPITDAINIIQRRLAADNTLSERTSLNVNQVVTLLEFCLRTTYFVYRGTIYQQKEGAAMGPPVSPIVANLYMKDFEKKVLNNSPVKP